MLDKIYKLSSVFSVVEKLFGVEQKQVKIKTKRVK